jgi:L-cysteine desulfidase
MTERQSELIELIKKEVKPALGCTEPIAVALAVAKAIETLEENGFIQNRMGDDFVINIEVSSNILKNAMGVGIPGTGMVGLHIAAALGAVCGKSCYGLEVLRELNDASISRAKEIVKQKTIEVGLAKTEKMLFIKASVSTNTANGERHQATVIIENDHDKITLVSLNGESLYTANGFIEVKESKSTLDYKLTVEEIYNFITEIPFEDIAFILESRTLNLALAKEGLSGKYGLKVGWAIQKEANKEVFGSDFMSHAMCITAAASDARMAGCTLPAMSNSGSGNQGITVTMPIIAYSQRYAISEEQLARALTLGHLIAIHIKGYLGKLSALCGCVIASTGASCGLVYLRGGSYTQVCYCIKNMIGNITGMVCDGAKEGCAMKVASGVASAIQSAVLAREGICISSDDGIIEEDIEKTIRNLGSIGSKGMKDTDSMILEIMVCK